MKKLFRRFILPLLLLCGLLLTTLYIIVSSERGTRWVINYTSRALPGELHIGAIKGRLTQTVVLNDINYHYQGTTITTDRLAIRWRLTKLLLRKISINQLKINHLKVKLAPTQSSATGIDSINFPLQKFHLNNTEIKQLSVESPATTLPVVLNDLILEAKIYPELLYIQMLTHMSSPTPMNFRLETSGQLNDYKLAFVVEQANNRWFLKGNGDLNHLQFHTTENQLLGGSIKLQGDLTFAQNLKLLTSADIKGINPQSILPNWPGNLNFLLKLRLEDNVIELALTDLNGTLKQQKVSGELHYQTPDRHDHFIKSDLHYGIAQIVAEGKINDNIDLKWDINLPKIQELFAEYSMSGSIISQGTLLGPRNQPNIKATISGQHLHFQEWAAEKIQLNANYQNNLQPINLQLSLDKVQHNQRTLGNITGKLSGTQGHHAINVNYSHDKQSLNFDATGGINHAIWQGTLNHLTLISPHIHDWHLQKAIPISFSQEFANISPLCLLHDNVSFCLDSQWKKGSAFTADIKGKTIPLDIFNPWLNQYDLNLHGNVSTAAKLIINPNTMPTFDLSVELAPGVFNYLVDGVSQPFHYQGGNIKTQLDEHKFTTKVALELLQKSTLSANIVSDPARWNPNNWSASPIQGEYKLQAPKLEFLAALIPKIAQTHGALLGHGTISGTLQQPTLSGAATVTHGGFSVPDVNAEVKNMTASGTLHSGVLSYQGTGSAGTGTFKISGTTQIINKQLHTQLQLNGNNMLVSNTPGVIVTATPDLQMKIVDKVMLLTGKLFIPKGRFVSYDYNDTLELPAEITYRQQTPLKPSESTSVKLTSIIDLKLGDNITIDSKGLSGKLVGNFALRDKPGGATTAYGQLSLIQGQYKFRGQTLTVERGVLNFNGGPVSNPDLNVRAIRRIGQRGAIQSVSATDQNRNVGIFITGTLAKHTLKLFSEPDDISQSDILSYLVLGQSITNASSGFNATSKKVNAQALLGAAQALNLSGGGSNAISRFKSQLEQKLGLTELDITSFETKDKSNPENTIQHTAFVLGRYLSPKLYVNYSFDILDQTNVFRIRYFLNKRWSIQSESSLEGNGVDLLYSFERG